MFQVTSSSLSSSSSSNSNSTNNDTAWVWMTLVPLGVTSVVSVCSNAISCYNFFIAWNMISQMHRRDIQLLQTCSGNQQQQQKQQRQLEIMNSINTKLYKDEESSSSSSISSSTTLPTNTTTRTSCPICLSDFEDSDEVSTSKKKECDHMFHKECLEIWLSKQSSCPYCRMELLAPSTPSSSSRSPPPPALRHPFVGW